LISTPVEVQRRVEGQLIDIRHFLNKYERVAEGQRMAIHMRRQDILDGVTPCSSELERLATLITIDDLWAEYLSALAEIRSGVHWVSLSGGARDPVQTFLKFGGFDAFREYLKKIHELFKELVAAIDEEIPLRREKMEGDGIDPTQRGSTWTDVTTDQPVTSWVAKALRGSSGSETNGRGPRAVRHRARRTRSPSGFLFVRTARAPAPPVPPASARHSRHRLTRRRFN
jgi:preprotein translocase subunit SecA